MVDRRDFLKSLGIVSGGAAVASCNWMAPEEKLSAYLTPPEKMVPGVAAYYATVCRGCPAGCGLVVKNRENRPIKLEGNPMHPVNQGKLCPRGQAFIQSLYSSYRLQTPLLRKNGQLEAATWAEALAAVSAKLAEASSIGVLAGLESGSFEDLMAHFTGEFGASEYLMYEPGALTSLAASAEALFGTRELPRVDLTATEHVLSLGADFLDTWVSPVEFARQWSISHSFDSGRKLQVDYVGPRRNFTATASDRWYRAGASRVAPLAGAILARVFDKKKASVPAATASVISQTVQQLEVASGQTGIPGAQLDAMVGRLLAAQNGMVLFGGSEVVGEDSLGAHTATLLTNYLTGALGKGIKLGEKLALGKVASEKQVMELLGRAASGAHDVLFVSGTNPADTLPAALDVAGGLEKAKFVVGIGYEQSETLERADVVLPVHHPLESWGDFEVTRDIAGLMQPVRAPLYQTKLAGDLFIELAAAAGKKMPHAQYKDYVVERWRRLRGTEMELPAPTDTAGQDALEADTDASVVSGATAPVRELPESKWEEMLIAGGAFDAPRRPRALPPLALKKPLAAAPGKTQGAGATLLAPLSTLLFDGRGATSDWLREVPDSTLQTAWEIPVEVATDVAAAKGIEDGDKVKLKTTVGETVGVAIIDKGLAKGTMAVRMGGGRSVGRHMDDTADVMQILPPLFDPSGELVRVAKGVTVEKVSSGVLASVMGSSDPDNRPLALAASLEDAKKGKYTVFTRHGEHEADEYDTDHLQPVDMPADEKGGERPVDAMFELQKHPDHRWGMTVDLDKCIGCGTCAVACYAENNVPVVGKEGVIDGRELSWIRIEKYEYKKGDEEEVRFLPVMCQHCDNAPCETVCPVFAAYHTADGLNAQVYNRCIGTRYCSNNCPYKVRRFNYFDYQRKAPANQQLNPDVTVRGRGVMEKCTFCVQRIREAQNNVASFGGEIKDGDVQPACVQTCPTYALQFGDFKKENWAMTRQARDPRGYRLLDYFLNTRPGVVYLRKVNTEGEANDE